MWGLGGLHASLQRRPPALDWKSDSTHWINNPPGTPPLPRELRLLLLGVEHPGMKTGPVKLEASKKGSPGGGSE